MSPYLCAAGKGMQRAHPDRGGTPGGFSTYLRISHSSRRMQEKFSPIESQPAVTARSASQV